MDREGRSAPDAYGVVPMVKLSGTLILFVWGVVACIRWASSEAASPFAGVLLLSTTTGLAVILAGLIARALRRPPR